MKRLAFIAAMFTAGLAAAEPSLDCGNVWVPDWDNPCECKEENVSVEIPYDQGICDDVPVSPTWYGCTLYTVWVNGRRISGFTLSHQFPVTNEDVCYMARGQRGSNSEQECKDRHFYHSEVCHPINPGPNDSSCNIYGMDENGCCKYMGQLNYSLQHQNPPGVIFYTWENPGLCGTEPSSGLIRMSMSRTNPLNICEDLNPCEPCTMQSIISPTCGGPVDDPITPGDPPVIPPVDPTPTPTPPGPPVIVPGDDDPPPPPPGGECPGGITPEESVPMINACSWQSHQVTCGQTTPGILPGPYTISYLGMLHTPAYCLNEPQQDASASATVTLMSPSVTVNGGGHGIGDTAGADACASALAALLVELPKHGCKEPALIP